MGKITHGFSARKDIKKLRLYQIWSGIKQRCLNVKHEQYPNYGGRGIGISKEWETSFETFLADMGYRPDKRYSIDRIDNSKGYSKENCRWATSEQQQQNTRFNVMITLGSATRSLSYWCKMFGIPHATASSRIKTMGMTPEAALTTPTLHRSVGVGERYGTLVVKELLEYKNYRCVNKHRAVLCVCDCGKEYKTVDTHLKFRGTKTCMSCSNRYTRLKNKVLRESILEGDCKTFL